MLFTLFLYKKITRQLNLIVFIENKKQTMYTIKYNRGDILEKNKK